MLELPLILERADELGASSVHLRAAKPPVLRVLDKLVKLEMEPVDDAELSAWARGVLSDRKLADYERLGDVDFLHRVSDGRGGEASYKGSFFRGVDGHGIVLQKIVTPLPTLEEVGVPNQLKDYLAMRQGLLLMTGPIGCGKTTTMMALLDELNRERDVHVLTVEKPIECVQGDGTALIQQVEVGRHVATVKDGVELARKIRPDILVVSELADKTSIRAVLDIADCGVLVLAGMHAASVERALGKIDDYFTASEKIGLRRRLGNVVRAVVGQILVHKQYGTGVLPVFEILTNTPEVRRALRSGCYGDLRSIMQRNRGLGMISLDDALFELVQRNKVQVDEAIVYAIDKERFEACRRVPSMP